ncbi:cathepsin S-like [Podarcis muralis]
MHLISLVALTGLVLLKTFTLARDPALDEAWSDWKRTHNKIYRERNAEDFRRTVWEDNLHTIEEHNREAAQGKHTFQMALNQFSDLTKEEFKEKLNGLRPDLPRQQGGGTTMHEKSGTLALPEFVDWRNTGCVTPVKDQGSCGSCWAFAAVGALESLLCLQTRRLIMLSEQNLVDCAWPQGNYGCNGGWPNRAFQYVLQNNGMNSERVYPYTGQDGNCKFQSSDRAVRIRGWVDLPQDDERALEEAVAFNVPVTVAVDASYFNLYGSGIFDYPCGTNLNHAVLAVGYGVQNGIPYWIIKNSWGPYWGENGYMRMRRGVNLCGVARVASYPV